MVPLFRGLGFLILIFWPVASIFAQTTTPTEAQKLKSQADVLEDKGAGAIDDGNMDQGL
jgi:hypothetical protein